MKTKITSQEQNPLLERTEICFEVEHRETGGTPSRLEVRKELASKLKKDVELVYVRKMETRTGTMTTIGEATAYNSAEQAELIEPEHIIARNTTQKETDGKKEDQEIGEEEEKGQEKVEQEGEETSG